MIEMLLVVAILGILFAILLSLLGSGQMGKARDAERKGGLADIKVAFEEYYNDNGCYPPPEILDNCGSSDLAPYLNEIPCDPATVQPYVYVPYPDTTDTCGGYRVYAALEYEADPVVRELSCETGCGLTVEMLDSSDPHAPEEYNYGVSEGVPVSDTSAGETEGPVYTSCCPAGGGSGCQAYTPGYSTCTGGILYETYAECRMASNGCW